MGWRDLTILLGDDCSDRVSRTCVPCRRSDIRHSTTHAVLPNGFQRAFAFAISSWTTTRRWQTNEFTGTAATDASSSLSSESGTTAPSVGISTSVRPAGASVAIRTRCSRSRATVQQLCPCLRVPARREGFGAFRQSKNSIESLQRRCVHPTDTISLCCPFAMYISLCRWPATDFCLLLTLRGRRTHS